MHNVVVQAKVKHMFRIVAALTCPPSPHSIQISLITVEFRNVCNCLTVLMHGAFMQKKFTHKHLKSSNYNSEGKLYHKMNLND
jgi:hypothetical protein